MKTGDKLVDWAVEIQAIAQTGLEYATDVFDIERYQKLRDISAEMMAEKSGKPLEKVKDLFCNESGYQTPKIATRAAVFKNNKILLVKETTGKWSLPGGWCDVNCTVKENCIKECKEESGQDIIVDKLIAVQDHFNHHGSVHPYGICDMYFLCHSLGGKFIENSETTEANWFSEEKIDSLPISENKNATEQIKMCFEARDKSWQTLFE